MIKQASLNLPRLSGAFDLTRLAIRRHALILTYHRFSSGGEGAKGRAKLKSLFKRAFADLPPPENVNRRKMGLGVLVGPRFRGASPDLLRDALLSRRSLNRGYFRGPEVRRLADEHMN